jgi:hypothetical protein
MSRCRLFTALAICTLLALFIGGGCGDSTSDSPEPRAVATGPLGGGGGMESNGEGGGGPEFVYDEFAPWDVVQFTDPRNSETYEIIDGRVIIGWKVRPIMPPHADNYFDVEENSIALSLWQQQFVYPTTRLNDTDVAAFMAAEQLTCLSEWPEIGFLCALLPAGQTVADAVANWPTQYPNLISYVDPDNLNYGGVAWPQGDPNDQRFKPRTPPETGQPHQWHLDNRFDMFPQDGQYDHPEFDDNVQALWAKNEEKAFGNYKRVIAIIDTGVDYIGQRDLQEHSASYLGTKYGCNTYDDINQTTFLARNATPVQGGRPHPDYLNYGADSARDLGHGSMVCGCACAYINNDTGTNDDDRDVAGVSHGCKYFPIAVKARGTSQHVPVYSTSALITSLTAVGCIRHIYDPAKHFPGQTVPFHWIEVVNWSTGAFVWNWGLYYAVDALSSDILFVCAVGNNNRSDKNWYPAAWPKCLAVAGYGSTGTRYLYSNYASTTDIAAPAVTIWSTDMVGQNANQVDLGYSSGVIANQSGTSFAAPQVAAMAGILSRDYGPASVFSRIVNHAGTLPDPNLPWAAWTLMRVCMNYLKPFILVSCWLLTVSCSEPKFQGAPIDPGRYAFTTVWMQSSYSSEEDGIHGQAPMTHVLHR